MLEKFGDEYHEYRRRVPLFIPRFAGIFALTGQVAELAGGLFPIAFIIISGFSA